MCKLPRKKPNIEEKKLKQFLTLTISKEVKFVKFGDKKANLATLGTRGGVHLLFHLLTCDYDDNDSSAPAVKIPPCQHMWFWMA